MDLRVVKIKKSVTSSHPPKEDLKKPASDVSISNDVDSKTDNEAHSQAIKVPDGKAPTSTKHRPAVNLYLTKNSGQYFRMRHAAIVPFTCEECGSDFESISDLVLHFRSHFNGSLFECSVCLTPFSSSQTLKKHMEKGHCAVDVKNAKNIKKSEPETNGVSNSDNKEQNAVQSVGKTANEDELSCKLCGKRFKDEALLADHVREHENQDLFTCEECGRCYQQEHMLDSHIKIHHVELWSCTECGKAFENKKRLMAHYELHSGAEVEKRHQCEQCGKAFVARSKLLRHMRVHTGERPFRCDVCGRGFNDRSNLFIHARVHTGEKPYACELCGKCFTGKNDLNRHLMIHSGTKPHTCKQCGKAFREKSKLNRHIKTHVAERAGEKPHTCPSCGKGFREKSKLRRHFKIHEREEQA